MSDKRCPDCGNSDIKKDSKKYYGYSSYCLVCEHGFGMRTLSKSVINDMIKKGAIFPRELNESEKKYVKEYAPIVKHHDDYDSWQIYLYGKNEKDEFIIDISEENITRCEQLYNNNPDDEDSFLRLLLLKIFSRQECKDLTSEFLKKSPLFRLTWICVVLGTDGKIYKIVEPYLSQLKNFLLWIIDVDPKKFKEEIYECVIHYCGVASAFFGILKIIGPSVACKIIDFDSLFCEDLEIDMDGMYSLYYIVAESFYSEKKWFEAFLLFEKLMIYQKIYKVTDEEIYKEFEESFCNFKDILAFSPTVEEIKNKSHECFYNLINSEEKIELYDFVGNINKAFFSYKSLAKEKDVQINNYSQIYNIFSELIKGDYSEAFKKWVSCDKRGITLAGLDIWAVTKSIMNLRDGIGSKEDNIKKFLQANPYMEDFGIIISLEFKLREFISKNSSNEGYIPERIRIRQDARKRKTPNISKNNLLSFSEYVAIICDPINWEKIFKKYFILKKEDSKKSKDELTSFLQELSSLRNMVAHPSKKILGNNEREKLRVYSGRFDKIYEKWKHKKASCENSENRERPIWGHPMI